MSRVFVLLLCALLLVGGLAAEVPLVAYYPMEPDAHAPNRLVDAGPLGYHGVIEGATFAAGHAGQALRCGGKHRAVVDGLGLLNKLGMAVTLTLWVKVDAFPQQGVCYLVRRWPTFSFGIGDNRLLAFDGYKGGDWYTGSWAGKLAPGEWTHIAFTFRKGGERIIYQNGKAVGRIPAELALWPTAAKMTLGEGEWNGLIDDVRLYAAELTPEQLQAEIAGTPPATRAASEADCPQPDFPVFLTLARYDMPVGLSDGQTRTRQPAKRVPGPDAVDWPALLLDGKMPLFRDKAEQAVEMPLRDGKLFQEAGDHVISPGNHWLRPQPWRWNQQHVYTTDRTARSWMSRYELWAFPVKISGPGATDVTGVVLKVGGETLYTHPGPFHSLTLLLPQNEAEKPYELSVAGRRPVRFSVGLQPVVPGEPREVPYRVNLPLPGNGPKLTVTTPERPETFPNTKAWEEDLAAMRKSIPAPLPAAPATGSFTRHLGVEAPRSPLGINAVCISAGMANGYFFQKQFPTTLEQYAAILADTGYDRVFEQTNNNALNNPQDANSYDRWLLALAAKGLWGGLVPDNTWKRPHLANANVAFYSHNLPDWHAPLYRDIQLAMQRLGRYPNLAGISSGGDNAGYVPYWDWAPPIPNRPWGEAFITFQQDRPITYPALEAMNKKDFAFYITRYDETFRQYGYFAGAVAAVNPKLVFTTGSFGSSPGVGGRGGWPWATIPGNAMHEGVPVQQAYDWNERAASKPMHLVALIDRLRSYDPRKPTWAVVDDFGFFFGREARQRAYALALTRGLQSIGSNFLACPVGDRARPDIIAAQQELFAWVHKYGGAYALTEPLPTIGILYVHQQALMRPVIGKTEPTDEELFKGSHEGKVTEALFLCHAAGFPAKVVTPEELRRGLPAGMQALLLVGLNRFDDTWNWFDGLEQPFQAFLKTGGRVLLDDESDFPLASVATGMRVRAYVVQGDVDATPLLLRRNAENLAKLRAALRGITPPIVTSADPTVWAIPTRAGDVQYVTVVNQAAEDGQSASKVVKPQVGTLAWETDRPIYDVRLQRKLTANEAARCDLTQDSFRYYALPPREVTKPALLVTPVPAGCYEALVTIGSANQRVTGVPVQVTVSNGRESATIYGASGKTLLLPLTMTDEPGTYTVTATELLSGLSTTVETATARKPAEPPVPPSVRRYQPEALVAFATRRAVPLTVALTPAQHDDVPTLQLAQRLLGYYRGKGRPVRLEIIAPNQVVVSLQPLTGTSRYPQWKTEESDLILLGNPSNNLLLLDQARACLLPEAADTLRPGEAFISYAWSPFVGEYDAINLVANDAEGLKKAVEELVK